MTPTIATTYRHLSPSDELQAHIAARAEKLVAIGQRLEACHVTLELIRGGHRGDNAFRVRLELDVPTRGRRNPRGKTVLATGRDLHATIDRAFMLAVRRLHAQARKHAADSHRAA